jgi:hypothetical protein
MARLLKDVIVTSDPLQTFPNGDYLYVELSRKTSLYDCHVKMARVGNRDNSFLVASARGKTIREVEASCYERALERAPYFPRPPYFKRGARRVSRPPAAKAAARS